MSAMHGTTPVSTAAAAAGAAGVWGRAIAVPGLAALNTRAENAAWLINANGVLFRLIGMDATWRPVL
jgi:hypothetical protein